MKIWHVLKKRLATVVTIIGCVANIFTAVIFNPTITIPVAVATVFLIVATWYSTHAQLSGGHVSSSTPTHSVSASSTPGGHHRKVVLKNVTIKSVFNLFIRLTVILPILSIGLIYSWNYSSYESSACQPFSQWKVLSNIQDYLNNNNYNSRNFFHGITAYGIYAQMIDNQCIGISDGGLHLDNPQTIQLSFSDGGDMDNAARAYRANRFNDASNAWDHARGEGVSYGDITEYDVEPLIYLEDRNVLTSNPQNYYDIVAVTMVSGKNDEAVDIGRNELSGFYSALDEYNSHKGPHMPSIRLLVANVGGLSAFAHQIEEQIKTLAENDPHLIGILGWPISGSDNVVNAIQDLEQTGLPIISPTATADDLSQINKYFFRMAPNNEVQAVADVSLVEKVYQNMLENQSLKHQLLLNKSPEQLSSINVVMLTENQSLYSSSLSNDFTNLVNNPQLLGFHLRYPIHIVHYENFDQDSITQEQIDKIVQQKPDIIYMAGYSQDAQTALSDLQNSDPHNLIKLVGGDGFAYIRDYPNPVYPVNLANDRLYYTSFSSPVSNCAASIHNTDFYGHYYGSFHVCAGNAAMLAHDAALTMFNAIEKLPYEGDIKAYRNTLWKALKQIDKYHPLSDPHMVTGIVTFDGGERADPLITFFHVTNGQISSFS